MPAADHKYSFRVPFASSIYPQIKPSDTLSILHSLNTSRPPSKRLPPEILLQIQREVHPSNAAYDNLRSVWTPIVDSKDIDLDTWDSLMTYSFGCFSADNNHHYLPLAVANFDPNTKRYQIPKGPFTPEVKSNTQNQMSFNFFEHISAADLLYRLRCFFPEVCVDSYGPRGYKLVWAAGIRHNPTGFILAFSEWKGGASLRVNPTPVGSNQPHSGLHPLFRMLDASPEYLDMLKTFSIDSITLVNSFSDTVADGSPRLVYFHPAADADISGSDVGYIAVPPMGPDRRFGSNEPYMCWRPIEVSFADLSSFHSLLPVLKYDAALRKIDLENGQTSLTFTISSSLLFYRLLCHYYLGYLGNTVINGDAPITSVWQVGLCHTKTDARIIFMDDHGLFDIRANEGAKGVMDDIVALLDALCSDECLHPYDGTVAGCVA